MEACAEAGRALFRERVGPHVGGGSQAGSSQGLQGLGFSQKGPLCGNGASAWPQDADDRVRSAVQRSLALLAPPSLEEATGAQGLMSPCTILLNAFIIGQLLALTCHAPGKVTLPSPEAIEGVKSKKAASSHG